MVTHQTGIRYQKKITRNNDNREKQIMVELERREFLKAICLIVVTLVIGVCTVCFSSYEIIPNNDSPRLRTNFGKEWLFARFGPMPDGSV